MISSIKQKSIVEQVAEKLRQAIDDHTLKMGERLTEQTICEQMNVSRTPVREAFRILQAEGYLTYRPRFGVVVSELNEKEIEDVWEARTSIEGMIARKTARLCDEKMKAQIHSELCRIHNALAGQMLDEGVFHDLDERYYSLHISGCQNRKLQEIARAMRLSSALIRRMPKYSEKRARASLQEVAEVYAAYLDNDADRAEEKNRIHFNMTLMEIKRCLQR